MKQTRLMSDIMNKEARDYSMYTIEDRAIPNLIDGFKPVQRLFLYSVLRNARNNFSKVAAIGGVVSEYGYHHAETAAQDAGALMANTWNNNFPIIQGRGNFGSRIVQEASAARYIYCTIHDNFRKTFLDVDQSPKHWDPEHFPPRFYLPIIPTVLLNGVSGIAVAYATDILPHDPVSVTECVKQYIKTGDCDEPKLKFPEFHGRIIKETDKKFMLEGTYEYDEKRKTKLIITEIPPKYDRTKYVAVLDALVDSNKIVSYTTDCRNGFRFEVTLKRDLPIDMNDHDAVIKLFKLNQSVSQNIVVIGPDRDQTHTDVRIYDTAKELIKDFVDYRLTHYPTRIANKIAELEEKSRYASARIEFINKVISGDIEPRGKTRKQTMTDIESYPNLKEFSEKLISMNIYHITSDEVKKLEKDLQVIEKELKHWKKTTPKAEYLRDLEEIF
ncbi:DNA topoisomerase II [Cronobacter phage S13]|jgi:DNA gyrase/topoisomerase IV subunit A|uniref:DNA topoisomerase II n=1 Tax=Cronobacter phage S13 TaxID=1327935 RepID=UPI000499FC25|nr:DNA topoisomerase II [Cronobacter phage S13]AIA65067.1 putative topoisomerase II medium subunit [Cronobacter phage S13]